MARGFFWTYILIRLIIVCLILLAIYIALSLVLSLIYPAKHEYRNPDVLAKSMSTLQRPVTLLFADGMDSNLFDWEEVSWPDQEVTIVSAKVSSNSSYRQWDRDISFKNLFASLGLIDEAVVVGPIDYAGKWSLLSCHKQTQICKESNLLHRGEIRILVDGEMQLWGRNSIGRLIPVTIKDYIDRSQRQDLILI